MQELHPEYSVTIRSLALRKEVNMFYHVWTAPDLRGGREYLGVQWLDPDEVTKLRGRGMVVERAEPVEHLEIPGLARI
jgi:hypothetical protein